MISIKLGDSLELLKSIDTESVDLIIADPPYNLGKNFGNNNYSREFDDYIKFSREWLEESRRILKPSGTIYVFMGVKFISYLYNIMDRELGFLFNSWIIWHYTQGMGKKKGFSPRHEDILMFNKSNCYKFNLDSVRIPQKYYRARNNMRGANPGDVWKFSHIHYCNENRQNHPTQKPEGLMERMILASTDENDLVLDPFAGSGTTPRVCQQLERHCIGLEINPDYVRNIKIRLKQPFNGFDSMDERMTRIPNDLNDEKIREEYYRNHIKWFLKNHPSEIKKFKEKFYKKYKRKVDPLTLFSD